MHLLSGDLLGGPLGGDDGWMLIDGSSLGE